MTAKTLARYRANDREIPALPSHLFSSADSDTYLHQLLPGGIRPDIRVVIIFLGTDWMILMKLKKEGSISNGLPRFRSVGRIINMPGYHRNSIPYYDKLYSQRQFDEPADRDGLYGNDSAQLQTGNGDEILFSPLKNFPPGRQEDSLSAMGRCRLPIALPRSGPDRLYFLPAMICTRMIGRGKYHRRQHFGDLLYLPYNWGWRTMSPSATASPIGWAAIWKLLWRRRYYVYRLDDIIQVWRRRSPTSCWKPGRRELLSIRGAYAMLGALR